MECKGRGPKRLNRDLPKAVSSAELPLFTTIEKSVPLQFRNGTQSEAHTSTGHMTSSQRRTTPPKLSHRSDASRGHHIAAGWSLPAAGHPANFSGFQAALGYGIDHCLFRIDNALDALPGHLRPIDERRRGKHIHRLSEGLDLGIRLAAGDVHQPLLGFDEGIRGKYLDNGVRINRLVMTMAPC